MHIRPLPALLLVLPLLMTACNGSHTLKMDARATPANTKPAEVDDLLGDLQSTTVIPEQSRISTYARQVQKAIAAQMNEPNAYAGKNCVINISLQPDGSVNDATAKEGDERLCKAAISAITRAKIPAAPDEKTYQMLKNATIDFRL
ncbi:TPA: cell envelope integrity protein TolA [Klebsiella michiganensis]|jgi:TolA protein|uniref:Cell envelope integrity protein TolA n=3 Tax=Klebsiella/Raoultella group TaxID=2890311 RepID=A0A2J4RMJ9_9ENTR|nr:MULTISPECIES: cell envelope integrity protein TolA [Enterobacteriaceae]HBS2509331.1 cell envelope integrity protein TolA [Klebsiella variicola subsp. variicola]HCT4440163.1 cell envelope integrity protein TolA [Klebsiella aerogenes]HED4004794.1 cell envelope integrity protein TolA [Enterobacter hormaechei subsp. hoffmannii]EJG2384219.1 cell envelope integrity protein TolA [Raoultella ornithinolytica]EJR0225527.1 cell envelope integrity protein TolA [Raoultella planticola]